MKLTDELRANGWTQDTLDNYHEEHEALTNHRIAESMERRKKQGQIRNREMRDGDDGSVFRWGPSSRRR